MRRGFSIVELLVVVGIVGVLTSLLAPAVSFAREKARQARCLSNVRQMGLGLQAYNDQSGCFPPGCVNIADPRYSLGSGWRDRGVLVFLLPFVEAASLADELNAEVSVLAFENRTAVRRSPSVYACPSDPQGGRSMPSGKELPAVFVAPDDGGNSIAHAS